jgi:phosphoserine phosphatase RsbU/P
MSTANSTSPTTRVLLIDDQAIVGTAVGAMMAGEADIAFEYCQDPLTAIEVAKRFQPTVILQDLMMPQIDGLMLLRFIRATPALRDVPMIVLSSKEEPTIKAKAFQLGANDYLVKLPDKLEVVARVKYHSRGYLALLERNEAYKQLAEREAQLAAELKQAAEYVTSLLPKPADKHDIVIDSIFVPSIQLGGDTFGHHWLDDDQLALYLLDVSGHGVGSSLMAVSAMNLIASRSLPGVDFTQPAQVLRGLTNAFDMEQHSGKYFTIWYGVYQRSTRKIRYSGAAHPNSILLSPGPAPRKLVELESTGPVVGFMADVEFDQLEADVAPGSHLLLISDGTFEIDLPSGDVLDQNTLNQFVADLPPETDPKTAILDRARTLREKTMLNDDFSAVWVRFPS